MFTWERGITLKEEPLRGRVLYWPMRHVCAACLRAHAAECSQPIAAECLIRDLRKRSNRRVARASSIFVHNI